LSNDLFDVHCSYKESKEIWDSLILKYIVEDIFRQRFIIANYYHRTMNEEKRHQGTNQRIPQLLEDLKTENISIPDKFLSELLIEKLLESWTEYKQQLKHRHKQMSLSDLIIHIIIEDTNRKESVAARTKAMSAKVDMVQDKPFHKRYANKTDHNNKNKYNIITHVLFLLIPSHVLLLIILLSRKKGVCFVCGKPGHFAPQCRYRIVRNDNPPKPRANLVEGDDIIAPVISQVNVVTNVRKWVVDFGATRHICANKSMFTSYTTVGGWRRTSLSW